MGTIDDADDLLMWSYEEADGNLRNWPNLHSAANALGWDKDRARAAFAYLSETGFIEAKAIGGTFALTTAGIDAAESRLGNNTAQWSERWALLKLSYELAAGNMHALLNLRETGERLHWEHGKTQSVFVYLASKGLLKPVTLSGGFCITEYTIDLIERATEKPDSPTGLMPPLSSLQVHIRDSFNDSTLVNTIIASPGASLISSGVSVFTGVSAYEALQAFAALLAEVEVDESLPMEQKQEVVADIQTCQAQLAKKEPLREVVGAAWTNIKRVAGSLLGKASIAAVVKIIEGYLS